MKKRKPSGKKLDLNQLAASIADQANDPTIQSDPLAENKDPAAVARGLLGGAKGGKARAKKMTKQERSEAARKAALARWQKD